MEVLTTFTLWSIKRSADNNDVTLYTNNVTQNPNYDGVSFFTFYKNIFKGKSNSRNQIYIWIDFFFYMPNL